MKVEIIEMNNNKIKLFEKENDSLIKIGNIHLKKQNKKYCE